MDASDDHFGHRSISPRSAGNRRTSGDFVSHGPDRSNRRRTAGPQSRRRPVLNSSSLSPWITQCTGLSPAYNMIPDSDGTQTFESKPRTSDGMLRFQILGLSACTQGLGSSFDSPTLGTSSVTAVELRVSAMRNGKGWAVMLTSELRRVKALALKRRGGKAFLLIQPSLFRGLQVSVTQGSLM